MAEVEIIGSDPAGGPAPEPESSLFHRRIEFHAARKAFSGFGNNGSGSGNGFKLVTLNPNSETHSGFGSGKKSESSEVNDAGLDPELNFEITFRRIGAGLSNLGNTCFLNSVLQCLTYTEPLAAYLQSGKHQNSCRTAGFCALCAIQKHVSRALQSTGRILAPKDLVTNLRCVSRNFTKWSQQDAHEYMVNLLESMHKCCLPSGVPSESPSAYDKSLVYKIFGGRLRSQVKCMQCSYCSNKLDPFLDLSLELVKADSLLKALAHFTAREQLDGGAKQYNCQQCKQKVRAVKQLTIHNAPYVLAFHLKRFSSYAPGKKIDKSVTFGPTLDMKPFVTGPYDGDLSYTLYGVLVHSGYNTHSGHYYCFVRTSTGMWYSLDDGHVVQVNERTVLAQKAYMLFYVRDRKNFLRKKPVDVVQKGDMVMNAAFSKLNLELKEKIQNGSVEKKLNVSFSAALPERDALSATAPKETPSEKNPAQNANSTHSSVLIQTKDPVEEHSTMNFNSVGHKGESTIESSANTLNTHSSVLIQTKDPVEEHSTMNVNSVGHKGESTIESSANTFNTSHVAKNVQGNYSSSVAEDRNASSCLKDTANGNPNESAKLVTKSSVPCTSSGETCKIDSTNSEVRDSNVMPMGTITEASNKSNHVKDSQQNSIGESQVGGSSGKTSNSTTEETHENGQRVSGIESLSGQQATTKHLPCGKIKNSRRSELKVKRKLFKVQVGTTMLSSNILFGVRKKKHKQRKHHSLKQKSEHLLIGNDLSSNTGQSVIDESLPVAIENCTHSQKKKSKCEKDGKIMNLVPQTISGKGSGSSDVLSNELKERVVSDGTTLSAEKQPQLTGAKRSCDSEDLQRELRQTGMMSMLTRGLEETTVARWDGLESSLSDKTETRAVRTAQIGHIGDEWDEEYDRGKRKKIRGQKMDFGGPNLFQEIATRNSKNNKRAKLEISVSGNQPFRI